MTTSNRYWLLQWICMFLFLSSNSGEIGLAYPGGVELIVDTSHNLGEIDLTRYSLGQGGLSEKPMIDGHIDQIAQLHPTTIRLFVQEYFNLYPERDRYHWETLDKAIEAVLATGAKPIMALAFKPKVLYPKIDHEIVHPTDYAEWEELISRLVKHCNQERKYGIEYWEVGNEVDIGESGGCPYKFKPEDYVVYYDHTVKAILRADSRAKIGGPALAGYKSPLGDALIEHCGSGKAPLHFLSWHMYNNDPGNFRQSIRAMKAKLAKYPALKDVETILDEWNMSLSNPIVDPHFQPAFILENTYGFYEEHLSRAAYYHIRDFFVEPKVFSRFMSEAGTAFMEHWWNVMPQYDGLFDHQGRVRPAYYAFKLMSLIKGQRLPVTWTDEPVRGFAARESHWINTVFWNFPLGGEGKTVEATVRFPYEKSGRFRLVRLNPDGPVNNLELERSEAVAVLASSPIRVTMRPYEVFWVEITE